MFLTLLTLITLQSIVHTPIGEVDNFYATFLSITVIDTAICQIWRKFVNFLSYIVKKPLAYVLWTRCILRNKNQKGTRCSANLRQAAHLRKHCSLLVVIYRVAAVPQR